MAEFYIKKRRTGTETKFIGVAGAEEADFLIYLSELLTESNKRVAVIDNSPEGDIFALLPFQEKENIYTYHGVEYHRDFWETKSIYQEFDIVFLTIGTGGEVFHYPAEVWYIFLTADRRSIEKTAWAFQSDGQPVILFLRNFCDYKITAAFIRNLWKEKIGPAVDWYEIPFDVLDYEYYIRMQYEPVNEYKQLSKEMREALTAVASSLTGLTKKEEETIYKRLKRGKRTCR